MLYSSANPSDSRVYKWDDISDQFKGADILLGNGFSINLCDGFDYSQLFSTFLNTIPEEKRNTYSSFKTANFESILKSLDEAARINSLFEIVSDPIEDAIGEIRNGLIGSIFEKHPRPESKDDKKIKEIEIKLRPFNSIFTLNYDLFLYYVVLSAKDSHSNGETIFKWSDFFWGEGLRNFRVYQYPLTYTTYKPVYYLHGAIFIFNHDLSAKKRTMDFPNSNLLEAIGREINSGEIPLFISEGSYSQKRSMIYQNEYLSRGFEDFMTGSGNLVIYGASLLDPDKHIIEAINKRMTRKIAISLYLPNLNELQRQTEMLRMKSLFKHHELFFFDSATLF